MKKSMQIKSNCLYGIMLAAVVCMASGCAGKSTGDENASRENNVEIENSTEADSSMKTDNGAKKDSITITKNSTETDRKKDAAEDEENLYEEWYRTNVASYQWARIRISDYKAGESFQVTLDAAYFPYSGMVGGTAEFIDSDTAVLYDENVESFLRNKEGDHGIYFQFLGDSIVVTHDVNVRAIFGGGGIATAEGTYIQGEPEYTNCTDVGELFAEDELAQIQELLGDNYQVLFENVIESGEVEECTWDGGCLWKAYRPPYSAEWCNIVIYDDGRIYIEGRTYNSKANEFYTNSGDAKMPDVETLQADRNVKKRKNRTLS